MMMPSSEQTVPAPRARTLLRAADLSSSRLVDALECRMDEVAKAALTQLLPSMQAYPPYGQPGMNGQLFELGRQCVRFIVDMTRTGRAPNAQDLAFARQVGRSSANAAPLAALLQGGRIGSRTMRDWIASQAGSDTQELRAALSLTVSCFEIGRVVGANLAAGYVQERRGGPMALTDIGLARVESDELQGLSQVLLIADAAGSWYDEGGLARLSPRERELLDLLSQGLTNKEIALRLRISLYTTKEYMSRILEKTRLPSRAAVAALYSARRQRILE